MIGQKKSFPPVNVGDVIDVRIEAVGAKGDGIARVRGFILFVPNTKEGDEVRVKVNRVLNKVGFAEIASSSEQPTMDKNGPKPQAKEEALEEEQDSYEDTEDFGEE